MNVSRKTALQVRDHVHEASFRPAFEQFIRRMPYLLSEAVRNATVTRVEDSSNRRIAYIVEDQVLAQIDLVDP